MPSTDLDRYRRYLNGLDLTDQEKIELIGAIRAIAEKVLDKEYRLDVHPDDVNDNKL